MPSTNPSLLDRRILVPAFGGASLRLFDLAPLDHPRRAPGSTVSVGWSPGDVYVFAA